MDVIDHSTISLAVTAIGIVVVYKLVDKAIDYFWKKGPGTEYVTKADCAACKASQHNGLSEVCSDLKSMKRLLFLVAMKSGVDPEETQKLVG